MIHTTTSSTYIVVQWVSLLRCIVSCTILSIWCIYFFLQPLKHDALIMHEQQLDPTEIILIPYDIQRLCIYVIANVGATISIQSSIRIMIQTFIDILLLSIIISLLFVLCGASPYSNLLHTYCSTIYFITLTWFLYPSILIFDISNDSINNTNHTDDSTTDPNHNEYDKNEVIDKVTRHNNTNTNTLLLRLQQLQDLILLQLRGQSIGIVDHSTTSTSGSTSTMSSADKNVLLYYIKR